MSREGKGPGCSCASSHRNSSSKNTELHLLFDLFPLAWDSNLVRGVLLGAVTLHQRELHRDVYSWFSPASCIAKEGPQEPRSAAQMGSKNIKPQTAGAKDRPHSQVKK